MTKSKGPRGAPDLLPPDSELLSELETLARTLSDRFGYRRIELPIFEHTDVFLRTVGESSDVVVQKQMYTFEDAGGRSLTLRPEGTAGVARAFIEHSLPASTRLYYIGSFFRYERPAKGTDRQFFSWGIESFGSASPVVDAEGIALAAQFFSESGAQPQLLLNSIGCPDDRKEYLTALREALAPHIDDLCNDCHRRLEVNPMRVFDCKIAGDRRIIRKYAPTIREYLCPACKEHHAAVERILETLGVAWKDAPDLVRGLDYYTRTVFEFEVPGFPTLGGGGRYDLLVEQLGGQPTPAFGFGLGLSRTLTVVRAARGEDTWRPDVHVVWLEGIAEIAVAAAMDLRRAGLRVTLSDEPKSMRSQLREANRLRARRAVILGPEEVAKRVATVRDMESSEQREVPLDALVTALST